MLLKNKIISAGNERLVFREWGEAGHRDNVYVLSATGKIGYVRHISFMNDDYVLWWLHCEILKDTALRLNFPDLPSLGLFYTFRNDIPYKLNGFFEGMHLKDHFNMMSLPSVNVELYLNRGEYEQFGIEFKYDYLLRNNSQRIQGLMENHRRGIATLYSENNLRIAQELQSIITELNTLPFIDHGLDKMHLNVKVLDLLDKSLAMKVDTDYYKLVTHSNSRDSDIITKVHEHILSNLNNDLTIENLAKKFGIHKIALRRRFKEAYGEIPSEFIREARMELAKKLLIGTNLSIKEITATVRFSNSGNFSNAFKKRFNVWPKQLRRNAGMARK